jgi:hypothetical protein
MPSTSSPPSSRSALAFGAPSPAEPNKTAAMMTSTLPAPSAAGIVNPAPLDWETNGMEGFRLVAAYVILAIAFYFLPA